MRHLFMADRYTAGDVEAEPVIGEVRGSVLRLELDDAQVIEIQVADVALALVGEAKAA